MEPLHFDELKHGRDITLEQLAIMLGKVFARHDTQFDAVESRLDRIETLLMEEQRRDIEDLKKRMKRLEDVLAA